MSVCVREIQLSRGSRLLVVFLNDVSSSIEVQFFQSVDEVSVGEVALLPPLQYLRPVPSLHWVRSEVVYIVERHEVELRSNRCPVLVCTEDLCHLQECVR